MTLDEWSLSDTVWLVGPTARVALGDLNSDPSNQFILS